MIRKTAIILVAALFATQTYAAKKTQLNEEQRATIEKADKHLTGKVYSVVFKDVTPPSGDKHDYISMGPYWWPNPDTADGLPYINRDGEINPERNKFTDVKNLSGMTTAIGDLAKGYKVRADAKYARRACELLRIFFLDEATHMNPNQNHAQFVPGLSEGRGFGILDMGRMVHMFENLAILKESKGWDESVEEGLKAWMREYRTWLSEDELGHQERATFNNHGTYYDRLYISICLFLDDKEGALNHLKTYTLPRIEQQILADGSQPEELARTKSWHYTNMNLTGFLEIAKLAERFDFDMWHYQKGDQVYIKSMIDWFIPYLTCEKEWTWKQISDPNLQSMHKALSIAAEKYNDNSYLELSKNFNGIKLAQTK